LADRRPILRMNRLGGRHVVLQETLNRRSADG
jgi:hypothetical protein